VLVDVPAPVDHLLLDGRSALTDHGLEAGIVCRADGWGREQGHDDDDDDDRKRGEQSGRS
jgi:hypothetical protein